MTSSVDEGKALWMSFSWTFPRLLSQSPVPGRADTQRNLHKHRKWFNKNHMKFKWEILQLVLNNLMNQHRLDTNYPDSNSNEKRGQAGHKAGQASREPLQEQRLQLSGEIIWLYLAHLELWSHSTGTPNVTTMLTNKRDRDCLNSDN